MLVYALGFLGQGLYGARALLQWLASERAGRSVLPRGFWELSLAGGACSVLYGLWRRDLVFLAVVAPNLLVYTRNLLVRRPASPARLAPAAAALSALLAWGALARPAGDEPFWAAVGAAGSLVFSSRFLVQWWLTERAGRSHLPAAFWVFSLAGCPLLLAYGVARRDPVLILGFSLSPVPYLRNLLLLRRA